MTLLSPPAGKEPLTKVRSVRSECTPMDAPALVTQVPSTAAEARILAWSRMTSKQKLADMLREDRRRKGRK
jgi:hypothetical protein